MVMDEGFFEKVTSEQKPEGRVSHSDAPGVERLCRGTCTWKGLRSGGAL